MSNKLLTFTPDLAGYNKQKFSKDLMASLVVFLVAVPLGLGIALASGAPLVSGIIACAVGGIVAGLLSGAPLQVSGPAAGLTLLTYGVIQQFGWPLALTIFIAAGVLQLALGLLKIGRSCLIISPAVVKGMLAGIGIVIALAQLHVLLGGTPQSSAIKNILEMPSQFMALNSHAALTGLVTLAILIGWDFLPARAKVVPGALVGVMIATLLSAFVWTDVTRITLPEQLLVFQMPILPASDQWGAFLMAAASVAIVASVESLLCAVATDKLHQGPKARLNQELVAQGAGNIISGGLGGLPITGVIVRSSANIAAGATSRVSAMLHGVWIIVFIALFAPLVKLIPLAALAGLLVHVGLKLVNIHHIRELKSHREELIYGTTVLGVVCFGLLEGVAAGIAVAFVLLFRRLSTVDIQTTAADCPAVCVKIDGALTFLNVPKLTAALSTIPAGKTVDLDLAVTFMDHAAFEAIHSWKYSYESAGGTVIVEEIHEGWYHRAANGQPIVVPENKGRYALASVLSGNCDTEPHDLTRGVKRFHRSLGEALRPLYSKLANGQSPTILFITCCDSRVDPAFITAAKPGELFVVRNIGNQVPACEGEAITTDSSVRASVDYALEVLNVKHIVVCGHSDCGAMKALLTGSHKSFESLTHWLGHSEDKVPEHFCHAHHDKPYNQLARWNVAQQLTHLETYGNVAQRLTDGRLQIHGWYFDIEKAEVHAFDRESNNWSSFSETQASEVPVGVDEEPSAA